MDAILHMLNEWRESQEFTEALPYLRMTVLLFAGLSLMVIGATVQSADAFLAAARASVKDRGLSDKEAAAEMGLCQNLYSRKIHGVKPGCLSPSR